MDLRKRATLYVRGLVQARTPRSRAKQTSTASVHLGCGGDDSIDLMLAGKKDKVRRESAVETVAPAGVSSLPTFTLSDLSGRAITAADLADRVVVVEFWATSAGVSYGAPPDLHDVVEKKIEALFSPSPSPP